MVVPAAKRQAVAHLVAGHGMSERRACRVIGLCRMTMRYEVVRQDDPVLRERLKELAKVRRRFGYRWRCPLCPIQFEVDSGPTGETRAETVDQVFGKGLDSRIDEDWSS